MIYQAFINHLHPNENENDNDSTKLTNIKVDNKFDYKLRLRVNYIEINEVSKQMLDEFIKWQNDEDPPSAIIASCTYANFMHGNLTDDIINTYSRNLTKIVKSIDKLSRKKTKILWKLQDPVVEEKLSDEWKNVVNKDIDKYNQVVYDILQYSDAQIWSSSRSIATGLMDETNDGYKLGSLALQHDVQILLNMYCNDYMNFNDGTCCSSAEPYTILQVITYAIFGVWLVMHLFVFPL